MKINELKDISNAPSQGQMLVYTRNNVFFEPYDSIESVKNKFKEDEVLEIHMFDEDKEYRAILSTSKRFKEGKIEAIVDFANKKDSVYPEHILLENTYAAQGKITVLNHIVYGENGMASIDQYRFVMERRKQ